MVGEELRGAGGVKLSESAQGAPNEVTGANTGDGAKVKVFFVVVDKVHEAKERGQDMRVKWVGCFFAEHGKGGREAGVWW